MKDVTMEDLQKALENADEVINRLSKDIGALHRDVTVKAVQIDNLLEMIKERDEIIENREQLIDELLAETSSKTTNNNEVEVTV